MPIRMEISSVGKVNENEPKELDAEKRDKRMPESECGEFYIALDEFQSDQDEGRKKPNQRERRIAKTMQKDMMRLKTENSSSWN